MAIYKVTVLVCAGVCIVGNNWLTCTFPGTLFQHAFIFNIPKASNPEHSLGLFLPLSASPALCLSSADGVTPEALGGPSAPVSLHNPHTPA